MCSHCDPDLIQKARKPRTTPLPLTIQERQEFATIMAGIIDGYSLRLGRIAARMDVSSAYLCACIRKPEKKPFTAAMMFRIGEAVDAELAYQAELAKLLLPAGDA